MIVSVLPLRPAPGRETEFEAAFTDRLRVLARAGEAAGMASGMLLRPRRPGGPYLVIAGWNAPEDYQAWLDHPARAEVNAVLARYAEPAGVADLFEVVQEYRG